MEFLPDSRVGLESKTLTDYIIKDFTHKLSPFPLSETQLKKLTEQIEFLKRKIEKEVPIEALNKIRAKADKITHPKERLVFYLTILGHLKNLKNISLDDYLAFFSLQGRLSPFTLERIETIEVKEKIAS